MNPEILARKISSFGYMLLEEDFALNAKFHNVVHEAGRIRSIMWQRTATASVMISNPARIADYIALVENEEYSYLMGDGGIIQIAIFIEGRNISKHRFLYYPCPFHIEKREMIKFQGGFLEYLFASETQKKIDLVFLKSPLRFDYAPKDVRDYHPASHVTINDQTCRIPARAPLPFDAFMKFILENFYPEIWASPKIRKFLKITHEPDCLTPHDVSRLYFNWDSPHSMAAVSNRTA